MELLEDLEKGLSLQDSMMNGRTELPEVLKYLEKLRDLHLGDFVSSSKRGANRKNNFTQLNFKLAHLELTEQCNLCCVHCYSSSGKPIQNCKTNLTIKEYRILLNDIYKLGFRTIQFIGGEPFMRRKLLRCVANNAREKGFHMIEIFSNGTMISNADLQWMKKNELNLAVSIYGSSSSVHDCITGRDGSWLLTVGTIQKAVGLGIPVRVAMVVMRQNENDIGRTSEFVKNSLGVTSFRVDFVRPSGRGCYPNLLTESACNKQMILNPSFKKISRELFWAAHYGHNCFNRKICVSPSGDIYPCIMERTVSYGNIRKTPLGKVLRSKKALLYRLLSKEKIESCKDCEYRYCCFDCRVKARAFEPSNIFVKPWWCAYDPYLGEWNRQKGG